MTVETYSPPLNSLLTFGDCREIKETPNYVEELGLGQEHIPELVRMATDEELNWGDSESLEVWAPIHAWRALGQLRAEAAIKPLISLFHELDDSDWPDAEMPEVFGNIGPAAILDLRAYLANPSHNIYQRAIAGNCLEEIGKKHPAARDECVKVLTEQLEVFDENPRVFNAFIIGNLLDLQAVESAPTIERAFGSDRVDIYVVGDWEEVQVQFGLKAREEVPQRLRTSEEIAEMLKYFASHKDEKAPLGFGKPKSQSKSQSKTKRSKNKKKRK